MTARTVELWPIDRPKPHPDNPRSHPEVQIAQLAKSIETFGFTHPVIVDENDYILAGHGKVLGAQYGGFTEVPVIVIAGPDRDRETPLYGCRQPAGLQFRLE